MTPSAYQTAIYDRVKQDRRSLSVSAVPGSGKTTTAIALTSHIRSGICVAFNKAIQQTLQARLPPAWTAYTFHSLGFRAVTSGLKSELSRGGWNGKDALAVRQRLPSKYEDLYYPVAKAMSTAKSLGFSYCIDNNQASWRALLDGYSVDIPFDSVDAIVPHLPKIYDTIISDTSSMTFDEMLLFPLLYDLRTQLFADVIVDETQDLSILQHQFLRKKILLPKGRAVAFGDPLQSIYAFRGADHKAMDHFASEFDVDHLPLSITYRLPLSVIALARTYNSDIQPRPGAPDGKVETLPIDPLPSEYPDSTLILCRNNAPLIAQAMAFLRDGRSCQISSGFDDTLLRFIKKLKTDDLDLFRTRLDDWYYSEYEKAKARRAYRAIGAIQDRYDTFQVLLSRATSVKNMTQEIKTIFSKARGPLLSTVHKAKGLEADRVHLLRPDLFFPTFREMTDWEKQQERNVYYVAITRTKEHLTFGPGDPSPY